MAQAYLDEVDRIAPGAVVSVHVVGSAATGDFVPGTSDLNFVAELAAEPAAPVLRSLAGAHRRLAGAFPSCALDGVYLARRELPPGDGATSGPNVRGGAFAASGGHGRGPLALHVLARSGVTLRGKLPTSCALPGRRVDALAAEAARTLAGADLAARGPSALSSLVLYAAQLHHLLMTGAPCSKRKAGLCALVSLEPRWSPLVEAALSSRRDASRPAPELTPEATAEYLAAVASDMEALRCGERVGRPAMPPYTP